MTYQSEVAMMAHEEGSGWTSSDESLVGNPRSAARLRRWPLVVGATLVAAVAGAAIALSRRSSVGSVSDVSSAIEAAADDGECADAFKQCGGVKFGHKCCKLGCTCKPQSDYFHGCAPSGGLDHCSLKAGSGPFTEDAIKLAKELVIKAKDAHDAYEKAADAEEKTLIKAHALLVASEAAKKTVDDEDKDEYAETLADQIKASKNAKSAGMHASALAHKALGVHTDRVKSSKKLLGWLEKAEVMQKQVGVPGGDDDSASSSSSSSSSDDSESSATADSMQSEVEKLKEELEAMKKKEDDDGSTSSSSDDETSSDEDSEGDASFEVISAD